MASTYLDQITELFQGENVKGWQGVQAQFSQDDADALVQWLKGQSADTQRKVLQQLQTDPRSVQPLVQQLHDPAGIPANQQQIAAATGQKPAASPAPGASTSTAAGQTTTQVGGQTTAQLTAGTQEPGSAWAANMLGTYTSPQLQGVSQTDAGAIAAQLGIDPAKLQSEYQAYTANWQQGTMRRGGLLGGIAQAVDQQPMSLQAFAEQQARAQDGVWQPAIDAINYEWQQQTGSPMPQDLIQQILSSLNALPPSESNEVQTYMLSMVNQLASQWKAATKNGQLDIASPSWNPQMAYQTFMQQLQTYAPTVYSGTGSSGGFTGQSVVSNYYTAHPPVAPEAAAEQGTLQKGAIDLLTQFGVSPSSDLVNAIASSGMSTTQLSNYLTWAQGRVSITPDLIRQLMSLPYGDPTSSSVQPGTGGAYLQSLPSSVKGVNWGQYQIAWGNLSPLWQSSFGRNPTNDELMWSMGKSTQQLQDFIDNSPSQIPGVSIKRYNDLTTWINTTATSGATTHAFSAGVDDSLVHSLHTQLQSASTQQATPGPMTPTTPSP